MTGSGFVAYLGRHTLPIAGFIGERLRDELGLDLRFDGEAAWAERLAAIDEGSAAVYWMCGLLTVERIDSGRLAAEIVAAPVFPGESEPVYRSVLVARGFGRPTALADLAGSRLAINEPSSWSGHHALRVHLAEAGHLGPFFATVTETGGHDRSIDLLLAGGADCAAIDATVWDDRIGRDPRLAELVIVDRTRDWPAPPFSVSRTLDPEVRASIAAALRRTVPPGLAAIRPATSADYDPIRRGMATSARLAW